MGPTKPYPRGTARRQFKEFLKHEKQLGDASFEKQLALMEKLWVREADMALVFTQQELVVSRIYNQLAEKHPMIYSEDDNNLYSLVRVVLQTIHLPRRSKDKQDRKTVSVIHVQRKPRDSPSRTSSSNTSVAPPRGTKAPVRTLSNETPNSEKKTAESNETPGNDALWGFLQACQPSMIEYFMKMKNIGCADIEMLHGMASWDEAFLRNQLEDQLSGNDGSSPPAPMHISSLIQQFRRLKGQE